MKEKKMECPWNQQNGYVCDYTFATRLFSFLIRNYESMSTVHPMDEEEFEYLLRCAADLKIWQMGVPSNINKHYFENLKGLKVDSKVKKYLSAIGAKDAYNIDKYLAEELKSTDSEVEEDGEGVYLAVNEDGDFRLFLSKAYRRQSKVYEPDLDTTLEDHYGKEYHPDKWFGKYKNYWASYYNYKTDEGKSIEPEKLPAHVQSMTWKDEPVKLI